MLAVAFVPASALVYLQYRTLSQVQQQMHQAMTANLQQALIGARAEAESELYRWPRQALLGLEIHEYLRHRDIEKMRRVAEAALRVCPYMKVFFGYRMHPGSDPDVFVFRPGAAQWQMDFMKGDRVEPGIRALIAGITQTASHSYPELVNLDGERQQVFLHLVDDDGHQPKLPHIGMIGYYGFAVPGKVLTAEYLSPLLTKHLARLAPMGSNAPGGQAVGAIFDGSGAQISEMKKGGDKNQFPIQEPLSQRAGILPGWTMRAGFANGTLSSFDQTQFARGIGAVVVIALLLIVALASIGMTTAREIEFSRAKTEFVASVSHELKTPLSLIRGFVETLRLNRFGNPSQREEYFGIIENEILRLSNLIDRILEMSKIEVGLKRYEPETVDVASLIEDTLTHFSHELERKSFTLERQIEAPLPAAKVDPAAFSQALLNLLSNAVKYSGAEKRILVRAVRNNGRLEVTVSDHGVGISKREQQRIFDRFYRAGHTAAKTAGAGLGLALVKHFATAHGGEVTVTSAPGKGSSFAILLPL